MLPYPPPVNGTSPVCCAFSEKNEMVVVLGSGNTNSQIGEMTKVSSPVAGDLVFFGFSATDTDHVGIYIGNGMMVDAPFTGALVRIDSIYQPGEPIGAVRP